MMRRVLVAASRPLAAHDLEESLAATEEFEVVRTITGLSEVDSFLAETSADVLVLDIGARSHPPDLFVRLKDQQPKLKIVAVGPDDPEVIRTVFDLGADGYHVHPADELAAGLRQVLLATEFGPPDVLTQANVADLS